ncbi:hypothetical protein SLS62_000763 [Diatrype stigma]|uniref:CTLH domain-containing protein n=1 Tax=Diatrype stigma TaxID=117547 RepID=A0AAN9V9V9_9PEZI
MLPAPSQLTSTIPDTQADSQSTQNTRPVPQGQILGRRRASDDEIDIAGSATEPSGASTSQGTTVAAQSRKRRRIEDNMLADEERHSTANGTSRSYANGKSQQRHHAGASSNGTRESAVSLNGSSKPRVSEKYFGHDREEVTRILIQALSDMGYNAAAESVSHDSGFQLESPTVAAFRNAVLDGNWDEAEQLLNGATASGGRTNQNSNGLVLTNVADRDVMRFWIRQQKFLELLEERETSQALIILRTEEDLMIKADWDGAYGQSRQILLSELSSKRRFPTENVLELDDHAGEVWQIAFSHDGTRLASCGSDKQVIIWDVPSFKVLHCLKEHDGGIGNISWSWDDTMLVTCCRDQYARLWDAKTGVCLKRLERFQEPVCSCVWTPDGQSFITGALDKTRGLVQWNLSGEKVFDWVNTHRVEDLTVSPNGRWLVTMDDKQHIQVYNLVTRDLEYEMDLNVRTMSISISQDSRHLLVNHQNGVAQLIDLFTREPVQTYTGHNGGEEFVIRSTFGGADESFVASGSEDGFIYIWHKASAQLVEKLTGHTPRCNSIAWSPTDPCLFASCGDDGKIKIWSNNDWRRTQQETMYRGHEASRISNRS